MLSILDLNIINLKFIVYRGQNYFKRFIVLKKSKLGNGKKRKTKKELKVQGQISALQENGDMEKPLNLDFAFGLMSFDIFKKSAIAKIKNKRDGGTSRLLPRDKVAEELCV